MPTLEGAAAIGIGFIADGCVMAIAKGQQRLGTRERLSLDKGTQLLELAAESLIPPSFENGIPAGINIRYRSADDIRELFDMARETERRRGSNKFSTLENLPTGSPEYDKAINDRLAKYVTTLRMFKEGRLNHSDKNLGPALQEARILFHELQKMCTDRATRELGVAV